MPQPRIELGSPRRWFGGAVGFVFLALVASACSDSTSNQATRPPAPTIPSPSSATAAAPTAAVISGTPQTAVPGTPAADRGAAEALLRRVTLFGTDVPPSLSVQSDLGVEDTAEVAKRAADPGSFLARAQSQGRVASSRAQYDTPAARGGTPTVRSATVSFLGEDGARAELAALRSGGIEADLASILGAGGGDPLRSLRSEPMPAPAVGDEAVAWRLHATVSDAPQDGLAIAFRRQNLVVMVVVFGSADSIALARSLDMRAMQALQR